MQRRTLLQFAGAAAAAQLALPLRAQQASDKPLRIVTGFAAGGSVDTLARLIAERCRVSLGRPVIVENKTGASGRLAVETVKAAPPDGNAVMLVPHGPMTLFPFIYKSLRFDPAKDFQPIGRVSTSDYCLTTGPQTGSRDIASFKRAVAQDGKPASFGTPGAGTVPHFLGIQSAHAMGIPMTHVPYRGSVPALMDLAGGVISATVTPLTEPMEMHKAGKITILATMGASRTPFLDGIPTFKEQGMDIDISAWFAMYAPAGTPAAQVQSLNEALQAALADADTKEKMFRIGMVPAPSSPAELAALQARETKVWGPVVASSGFVPED